MCTRFASLRSNAARVRRDGRCPGTSLTLKEFASWFTRQERHCHYCDIPEHLIAHLELVTQVGLPLQRLGVDRIDGNKGYTRTNMVLACFACNKARGNVFSADEMEIVGQGVILVWQQRLASVGVTWSPRDRGQTAHGTRRQRIRTGAASRARKASTAATTRGK